MIKLFKECFELFVRMRWLKEIDKQINKYNKLNRKTQMALYTFHALCDEYQKKYGEDLNEKGNATK
jgi:superfamily I DNA/RNA helicase